MSVTLGVASAYGLDSVANDVIMRIAGLVAAGVGRRHCGDWRQAPVHRIAGDAPAIQQRSSIHYSRSTKDLHAEVFGRPFVKRFAVCYGTIMYPVCLSVCLYSVTWHMWPNS